MCQLQECQSIRSGTSVLPYYRTPLVCVPDVIAGLAVESGFSRIDPLFRRSSRPCPLEPPDPNKHSCSLTGKYIYVLFSTNILNPVPENLFSRIWSSAQDHGIGFITQSSWVFQFHLTSWSIGNVLHHSCTSSAVPIQIPNRKQKQSSLSGMFCRISFIPNHFKPNRKRNRSVPVTSEFVTICDICDQNVSKSNLRKKLQKQKSVWLGSQIQNYDILWPSQMSQIECD